MKIIDISTKKPPRWLLGEVKKKWNIEWESSIIFTYNGVISSSLGKITEDLLVHESHHIVQQKECGGSKKWFKRYLEDDKFRYEQELECYRLQYQWLEKHVKNKSEKFRFLKHYAKSLSGSMYGNLTTFFEAMSDIKNYEK